MIIPASDFTFDRYLAGEYGDHCIIHGDCRDVLPKIPDKAIDLVLTDPPYGIGVDYGDEYNDKREDYWDWFREIVVMMKTIGRIVLFTHRQKALQNVFGYDWIGVWNKPGSFGSRIGKSMILPHWEPVFMYGIHCASTQSKYTSDVFTFNPEPAGNNSKIGREKWSSESKTKHPCPKPLDLIQKFIHSFELNGGGIILDPFLGSGTTLVAAKNLGRRAIGIEINYDYCKIAEQRLSQEVLAL